MECKNLIKTCCHLLWNSIYIDNDGKVYNCCHKKPGLLGNCYENKIDDLILNAKAEKLRFDSNKSKLKCFVNCTRSPKRFYINNNNLPYEIYNNVKIKQIHLNISRKCNIRCIMCGQNHSSNIELNIKKLIESINFSRKYNIIIQVGEPSISSKAIELIEYIINETNSTFSLISNGLSISKKIKNLLLSRDNEFWISLNASTKKTHEKINFGSNWYQVIDNIEDIIKKKHQKKSKMKITLRMTLIPENITELTSFIDFVNQFKYVNKITFGFDKKTMLFWIDNNKSKFINIFEEFMLKCKQSEISCESFRIYLLAKMCGIIKKNYNFDSRGNISI